MEGVTDKPDSPEDLLRMLFASTGDSFEDGLQQALARQTFVGGRRVVKQKLRKLPKRAGTTVHVVKVNLHGARPPVWRRLEIPSAMTLDLVHEVLQAAFDWDGYHLHSFETVCGEFGDPSQDDDWSERADESAVALAQVAAREKARSCTSTTSATTGGTTSWWRRSCPPRQASPTRAAPAGAARRQRRTAAGSGRSTKNARKTVRRAAASIPLI
jgi:hypothetical protein